MNSYFLSRSNYTTTSGDRTRFHRVASAQGCSVTSGLEGAAQRSAHALHDFDAPASAMSPRASSSNLFPGPPSHLVLQADAFSIQPVLRTNSTHNTVGDRVQALTGETLSDSRGRPPGSTPAVRRTH